MISDRDIFKLQEIFATKIEFNKIEDKMEVLEEKMDHVINSMDSLLGKYDDSLMEHRAGSVIMDRHTRHIDALAKKTGTVLPD